MKSNAMQNVDRLRALIKKSSFCKARIRLPSNPRPRSSIDILQRTFEKSSAIDCCPASNGLLIRIGIRKHL